MILKNCSQQTSIANGGAVEKPSPGNRSSIKKLKLKIKTKSRIANIQPEQKLNSKLQLIAPTSNPTVGNTLVGRRYIHLPLRDFNNLPVWQCPIKVGNYTI